MNAQALNYTPKAIDALTLMQQTTPYAWSAQGLEYLTSKLRQAQTFVLPEYGQLLDRNTPRPEVPGLMMKPPFPVVAIEYPAPAASAPRQDEWTAAPCSKRIALAWDHQDDMPVGAPWQDQRGKLSDGVVVASVCWYDAYQAWMPVGAAMHIPYEGAWRDRNAEIITSAFWRDQVAAGRISPAQRKAKALTGTLIPVMPEAMQQLFGQMGTTAAFEVFQADLMDEVNAYFDMVYALACRNVRAVERPAPKFLNRQRARKGKPLLKPFHVLELAGEVMSGGGGIGSDRSGPRDHIRRGHIRRLAEGRITWVNQTMVHGRGGSVDKVYSVRAGA
ncbi:hypothetical protein [Sphingomonas sanxanigenens]|uniref:Uncharacterized protein n=1 Tax=Sphingomonas sanxanigenens DSM 19645 = NX02 TaxID=1123269 RepID=W0AJ47_9SPHN|nr:hypothetical protein [Sphingomonas sanxanigenens]AHE55685.1 hypothetical protein NX02_20130 [Sphingomonas sanxanigenens DSM 19645 = NX02]